jgi:hypothetical protein
MGSEVEVEVEATGALLPSCDLGVRAALARGTEARGPAAVSAGTPARRAPCPEPALGKSSSGFAPVVGSANTARSVASGDRTELVRGVPSQARA